MLKVLLYGGGAREHALAYKIKQSPQLKKLYLCKPNDGFAELGEVLEAENFSELAVKAKSLNVDMLIVGPEDPLVDGIVDEFHKNGIACIGADKKWAMLEGSKAFAKEFMTRNNIPTAGYKKINGKNQIDTVLNDFSYPVVIKADGLAAGKGVSIVESREKAKQLLIEFLDGKFGEASKEIVVEEFLEGEEVSLISLWDGKTLLPFTTARDYKKLLNGNKGPNTGGMGAYCPVKLTNNEQEQIQEYVKKLKNALLAEKADFTGIVYSGLMMTEQGLKVLEYNMRLGDPETQPLLIHLENDILEIFKFALNKQLDKVKLNWKDGKTGCVVISAEGYPFDPKKDGVIENTENIEKKYGVKAFFAGVKKEDNKLKANGGRVLSICKSGETPFKDIYKAADELKYNDKYYRTDIGE
jgi:phosphoribosylamine--glycine ligase